MLTQTHIETIKTHFKNKGKKLEKILESAEFVNASLAAEEYTAPRGRAKAMKGVHQGLKNVRFGHREVAFDLQMAVGYGSASTGDFSNEDLELVAERAKATVETVRAWISHCNEVHAAIKMLDAARPKPKITKVGLSPKVTKTLTEMDLDLDLSTIKPAEIIKIEFSAVDPQTLKPLLNKRGKVVPVTTFQVEWSKGVIHGQSRFSHCDCEACGKSIPSGLVVPVEVTDRKRNAPISLWLGRDCAANIFGVKDVGIKR